MKVAFASLRYISLLLIFLIVRNNHSFAQNTSRQNYRNAKTQALFQNLKKLSSQRKTMFGAANANSISYYGHLKKTNLEESDCKDITGSNPAFIESDFMWFEKDKFREADVKAMKLAYDRGCVIGYCWHLYGMKSHLFYSKGKDNEFSEDKDLLKNIVTNKNRQSNPAYDWYLTQLDSVAIPTFKDLGCPVVYRPFHEMNGFWFWWGSQNCTPEKYQEMYRLTVDYLRSKGVRNVLYAWSPDTWAKFEYYPGDNYVDIIGLDTYEPGIFEGKTIEAMQEQYGIITDYAAAHDQVAAITETGCRKEGEVFAYPEKYPDFWTKYVLEPIVTNDKASRLVWICSWYNVDWNKNKKGQFYIPYKGIEKDHHNGQKAIDDFIKFRNHPSTLFENDLPDLYKLTPDDTIPHKVNSNRKQN